VNQNKTKIQLLTKIREIVLLPKFWGPPKSAALGLSLFSLMVNPRLSLRQSTRQWACCEEVPEGNICWR